MGLGDLWRMFCGPNTAYSQTILEHVINTYNVANMTVVVDGCIIELTPDAIAEALQVPIETEIRGQTVEKEELRPVSRDETTIKAGPLVPWRINWYSNSSVSLSA